MLFYEVYAKITTSFDQEKFSMAPLLYVDVETFGESWRKKTSGRQIWRQNRHTDGMHEGHLTPPM